MRPGKRHHVRCHGGGCFQSVDTDFINLLSVCEVFLKGLISYGRENAFFEPNAMGDSLRRTTFCVIVLLLVEDKRAYFAIDIASFSSSSGIGDN